MFKKYVRWKLEKYVKKYFKKHHPKLVVVVGSVGKTVTKTAIATVLAQKYRVQMEPTNHNSEFSVPLAVMGISYPPPALLRKFKTWRRIFKAMRKRIKWPTGVDVIVQELGTERPGEIEHFGTYLKPNIAVVTAVTAEHMQNFPGGLVDVAKEELSVAKYANLTAVNHDDVNADFAPYAETTNITDYGLEGGEYRFQIVGGDPLNGYEVKFFAPEFGGASAENPELQSSENAPGATIHLVGEHNVKAAAAAMMIGAKMGMTVEEVTNALGEISPVPGRMNLLKGVRGSTIIDDTYNSSPDAAIAALLTLYKIEADQRIAILGSMNELGNMSAEAHKQVGAMCDPNWLEWVITIGEEAARYLAPAAREQGCQVASFPGPIFAGAFANKVLRPKGIVLAKGSQDKVFAEEAVRILLRTDIDQDEQLVRQSPDWMAKKNAWIQSLRNIDADSD
ncbi:Mur ligase family protein [Candidatus Saccharibacteria bacterium]|nr:Mur ligase family protein [Candidatus Saccharibacteria bacterium]